jgi:hypothetical protein
LTLERDVRALLQYFFRDDDHIVTIIIHYFILLDVGRGVRTLPQAFSEAKTTSSPTLLPHFFPLDHNASLSLHGFENNL